MREGVQNLINDPGVLGVVRNGEGERARFKVRGWVSRPGSTISLMGARYKALGPKQADMQVHATRAEKEKKGGGSCLGGKCRCQQHGMEAGDGSRLSTELANPDSDRD